jgi:type IV pilus assembly protein PilX
MGSRQPTLDCSASGRRVPRGQRGAALAMGLVMLLVLTLLAISGINSASLEFVMAGNEQFRQSAFQAAETGIQQALNTAVFDPQAAAVTTANVAVPNSATDTFTYTVTPQLGGVATPGLVPGFSAGFVSTYQFEIQSVGSSTRSAQATNFQGVIVIAPGSQEQGPGNGLGNALTP